MPASLRAHAERIAQRTPSDRDRYADFLRTVSLWMVVLGHWLAAVVMVRDGELVAERLSVVVPWTQWLTWIFQVMPIFFFVGGFANARSWSRAVAAREGWASWMHKRLQRLLTPLLPLVGFWIILVMVLLGAGWSPRLVQFASQTAFAPLWFLGTYVLVIAFMPFTWMLHRRWGAWAVLPFVAAAAAVDAVDRAGVPFVEYANLWFVWAGIHQCGFFWHDKRLPDHPLAGTALFAIGLAALFAFVTVGGYPLSMVALGGDQPNNAGPPTVVLFALLVSQIGLILAVRRPMKRWLARPLPWAAVATVGGFTLTIFLWHVTALILAAALVHATGLWEPARVDLTWLATRPIWFVICGALLAGLVGLFGRFERISEAPAPNPWRIALGLVAVLGGITWINRRGLYDADALPVSAVALLVLVLGLALIGVLHKRGLSPQEA